MADKPGIVFVCVANSFRSQMAEAIARRITGDRWDIYSAGSSPGGGVHPMAIALMDEVGVDLRGHRSKGIQDLPPREWDIVVTMGCGDACPALRAKRRVDWQLSDPAALSLDEARAIRDRIVRDTRSLLDVY